jgi:hypothetical protein
LMAAALRNFSGKNTDSFRVFATEALYRRGRGRCQRAVRGPKP